MPEQNTQMVQAVSFPLAVALRGQKRGWVTAELAEKWGLTIFSILYRGKGPKSGGLLHTVEDRYAQNDQLSIFHDVVGDGTLWMVLVATLGNSQWHGVGAFIDKATALREVYKWANQYPRCCWSETALKGRWSSPTAITGCAVSTRLMKMP